MFLYAKLGLLMGFGGFVLSAYAAVQPFAYVSFVKDADGGSGRTLIVHTKTPGFTYNSAGLQISHPDFSLSGDNRACKVNPQNNWCLFPAKDNAVQSFRVARGTNRVVEKEEIEFQLALNARSQPISVQKIKALAVTPGRIIGYLYGWVEPPKAEDVVAAHYTHVLIAFGLFSTTDPGTINIEAVSGFDLKTYVDELHAVGVKVLLSLGGASTSIPDTTVSFTQAISLAASPNEFIGKFNDSMAKLVTDYGLDGFDFDIESGLNPGLSFSDPTEGCGDGTVYNPNCDIATLSTIINSFHEQSPDSLLTLAPQLANVAATATFASFWGNYASLVMQTAPSLTWVGFQIYNSGCVLGLDGRCYPLESDEDALTAYPDTAVAVAADLLEDWPSNFQPYKSLLTPSQVVLGYASKNGSGASDGSPAAVIPIVKDAIQCLRTGEACRSYTAPNSYPDIGGVFDWTLNFDADNNYAFSKGLYPCVVEGDCSN